MNLNRGRLLITKGDGWRKYLTEMPHKQMRPIGTVKVGKLEGALVLDLSAGTYMLIEQAGAWHGLDHAKVRAALDVPETVIKNAK